jgi:hypothetical protein
MTSEDTEALALLVKITLLSSGGTVAADGARPRPVVLGGDQDHEHRHEAVGLAGSS